MSKLVDHSITIDEAMGHIKSGKYVMPAFQRQYVWSVEQIEKLWDSILLDYPIATFLFWHVDEENVTNDTYFCDFLTQITFDSRKQADSVNYGLNNINTDTTDTAILDGQQRLTSLYLSLFGEASFRPKNARKKTGSTIIAKLLIELNKNKLTIDEEEYNSKKFDIRFSDKAGKSSPTQFELKSVLNPKYKDISTRAEAIEQAIANVPADSKQYARDLLNKLCVKVYEDKLIRYTEIHDMNQDDALEMFVRFNSGGKALKKAEITMSILEAYWPKAKTEFGGLLKGPYEGFGTDFVIRSALMFYGDVIKSNINKQIAGELRDNWEAFKQAFQNLAEVLSELKIDISRFASSWNVLLPIAYFIYYNPDYKENLEAIKSYLIRAVLFTYFQSGTTSKLQQMKSAINSNEYEINLEMLEAMSDLRVTDGKIEDVINAEKGSRVAGEALYYLSLEWLKKTCKYEQDHLHPDSRFESTKPAAVSMEEWKKWRSLRNRLPNLHLLEGRSNGSKNDMTLIDYYNEMNPEQKEAFCRQSFIANPSEVSLELIHFGNFFEKRKALLTEKLKELLM